MDEDGYTSIVQRKKDMIIVDGYNVYPSDVESVLYAHPAVRLLELIEIGDLERQLIDSAHTLRRAPRDDDELMMVPRCRRHERELAAAHHLRLVLRRYVRGR